MKNLRLGLVNIFMLRFSSNINMSKAKGAQ